ncbi:sulfite exporter TauE/SafE family protein [Sinorhizobium sp. BG8]|uniref:sulfite exporter TauE/SafE family protein n=1 Tax=Sinorhizobium sp. BG8 TaxID=2613773 RepID=UPI00193DB260|nr:sulfite exporter TauE/SafE family protein [Sinorhizobium sp. BG8]QRM53921.1 sulfite exporter TauE/SafE family protein [Sinorhizobium sp. BG8]
MNSMETALLASAGIAGGFCNAIAGGGTFFTLPALLLAGLPPVVAGATSAVAIWPGHAVALASYGRVGGGGTLSGNLVTIGGAVAGAGLLILAGDEIFRALVPWLILAATLLFVAAPRVRAVVAKRSGAFRAWRLGDFTVAVYGGYFGAGLGILLLALLTAQGTRDLRDANAAKNVRATLISSVAVAIFIATGNVAWREGAVVLAGAIAGGYLGGRLTRLVSADLLRLGVVVVGVALFVAYL